MQDRFEKCIKNLQARKSHLEDSKTKDISFFAKEKLSKNAPRINNCISALNKYKIKALELINNNDENKVFYETHFEAVVNLLEKLERTKPNDFKPNDFKLILPVDVQYTNTMDERVCSISTKFGAFAGYYAGAFVALMIVICLTPPTIPGLAIAAIVAACVLLCTALGAFLGFSNTEIKMSHDNYLKKCDLDLDLLKNTYKGICIGEELSYKSESANELSIDGTTSTTIGL